MATATKTMYYPPNTTFNLIDKLVTRRVLAPKDESGIPQNMTFNSSGHMISGCESDKVMEYKGDLVLNNNILVKGTGFMSDMNIYRSFDTYTISYGFHVTDDGRLELYKYDSRINHAIPVSVFGNGFINNTMTPSSQTATNKAPEILSRKSDLPITYN